MRVHFIGIGGIGISALSQYYLAKGHQVSGSDLVSSEITDFLRDEGIRIFCGRHKKENLPRNADLVVYSPAIKKSNPELKRAKELKIKCQSYPEALGELTKQYFTIAVSGTHGKSTTVAMTALILIKAGFDPMVIIGTKLKEFGNTNFRMGKSKYLLIEADEWQASFLNYWPKIIVLTNIEKEHLDYYKNFNNELKAFSKFISHLPRKGILIANKKNKVILNLLKSHYFISGAKMQNKHVLKKQFKVQNYLPNKRDSNLLKKILKVPGGHNVYDASAALTCARALRIPDKISFAALSKYKGAWRRFEIVKADMRRYQRALTRKVTIVSDYAHHPTEIKVTLEAAREKYPKRKIWCCFQPHQYQRTYYLFKDFVRVFRNALGDNLIDKLIITDIYGVAGREKSGIKRKISSKKLAKSINSSEAIYLKKSKLLNYLKDNLKDREVVIVMGAGDIYKLVK